MTADRIPQTPIVRYKRYKKGHGTVMINLQETSIDEDCSIRIWAKIDDAFKILAEKLDIDMKDFKSPPKFKEDVFYIPYDRKGKYLGNDTKKLMKLDLSYGAKVQIINPYSSRYENIGIIQGRDEEHFKIKLQSQNSSKLFNIYPIGSWMIEDAINGKIKAFDFANENPEFIDVENLKDIKEKDEIEQKKRENEILERIEFEKKELEKFELEEKKIKRWN